MNSWATNNGEYASFAERLGSGIGGKPASGISIPLQELVSKILEAGSLKAAELNPEYGDGSYNYQQADINIWDIGNNGMKRLALLVAIEANGNNLHIQPEIDNINIDSIYIDKSGNFACSEMQQHKAKILDTMRKEAKRLLSQEQSRGFGGRV